MYIEHKIESAEKRIRELQILVRHWKASRTKSKRVALEIIKGIVTEDYEREVA